MKDRFTCTGGHLKLHYRYMAEDTKTRLFEISPRSWEHPADSAALTALKQVPPLDSLVKNFVGLTTESSLRLISMASAVRVTERQFPRVLRLLQDACYILDWNERPEIFVSQSPLMNAGAVGVNKPFITLNSALVQTLSDDELLAVIAHELSHIMSGHVLYKTLLWLLLNITQSALPLTGLALQGIVGALREWDRKSELSADRASLLVVQDRAPVFTVLMKLAGGTEGELVLDEFMNQAAEYESDGTIIDGVHKLLNILNKTHPFPVIRLKELKVWHESGSYEKILQGEYKRRNESDDPRRYFEEAVKSYRDGIAESTDPLAEAVQKVGKMIGEAGKMAGGQAEELFKNIFKTGREDPKKDKE